MFYSTISDIMVRCIDNCTFIATTSGCYNFTIIGCEFSEVNFRNAKNLKINNCPLTKVKVSHFCVVRPIGRNKAVY